MIEKIAKCGNCNTQYSEQRPIIIYTECGHSFCAVCTDYQRPQKKANIKCLTCGIESLEARIHFKVMELIEFFNNLINEDFQKMTINKCNKIRIKCEIHGSPIIHYDFLVKMFKCATCAKYKDEYGDNELRSKTKMDIYDFIETKVELLNIESTEFLRKRDDILILNSARQSMYSFYYVTEKEIQRLCNQLLSQLNQDDKANISILIDQLKDKFKKLKDKLFSAMKRIDNLIKTNNEFKAGYESNEKTFKLLDFIEYDIEKLNGNHITFFKNEKIELEKVIKSAIKVVNSNINKGEDNLDHLASCQGEKPEWIYFNELITYFVGTLTDIGVDNGTGYTTSDFPQHFTEFYDRLLTSYEECEEEEEDELTIRETKRPKSKVKFCVIQ